MTIIDDISQTEYKAKYRKKYYADNKDRLLAYHKNDYQTLREEVKRIVGEKCALCGSLDFEYLEIDHIHSDGAQQRKLFNGHKSEWRHYRNNPLEAKERLQLLCPTCHRKKKKEKNEVPYSNSSRLR